MVATTRSKSRARMAEETKTTLDPTSSPKKQTPKTKGTEKPKPDGDRSRPRTRRPPGEKPRSASTRTPPRRPKAESVESTRRCESKSVSRSRAAPTKKGGNTKGKNVDADETVGKRNVKTKPRRQSKATLKKETVTKEEAVKVKPAAKKPPAQKRPRGQSQPKQLQKSTTPKKPKLEVKNLKEKPAATGRAKRCASQAPPKKTGAAEAYDPEEEPIARRTRSRSKSVAPPPVKKAPAPRVARSRGKKALPVPAVEVPISVEEPSAAAGTEQNESAATEQVAPGNPPSPTPEKMKRIVPENPTGSSEILPVPTCSNSAYPKCNISTAKSLVPTKASLKWYADTSTSLPEPSSEDMVPTCSTSAYRKCNSSTAKSTVPTKAQRKCNTGKINTLSEPLSADTFEMPADCGPVPDEAIDTVVSALVENANVRTHGRTLASVCYSILARAAGVSDLKESVPLPEVSVSQARPASPASDSSSIETVQLDQDESSEPRMEVPAAEASPDEPLDDEPLDDERLDDEPLGDEPLGDEPLNDEPLEEEPLDDEPVDHEPEGLRISVQLHVQRNQGGERQSYTVVQFTEEQQEELEAIFRGCFDNPHQ